MAETSTFLAFLTAARAAVVEGAAQDRPLSVDRLFVAQLAPQPEGDLGNRMPVRPRRRYGIFPSYRSGAGAQVMGRSLPPAESRAHHRWGIQTSRQNNGFSGSADAGGK
jgi:hypothetical protein